MSKAEALVDLQEEPEKPVSDTTESEVLAGENMTAEMIP